MSLVVVHNDHTVCMDCNRPLPKGAVYSERLLGVVDDKPVMEVVCLTCATRGATS